MAEAFNMVRLVSGLVSRLLVVSVLLAIPLALLIEGRVNESLFFSLVAIPAIVSSEILRRGN